MDVPDQSHTNLEELEPFPHTDSIPDPPGPQKPLTGQPLRHYHLPAHYQDLFPDSPAPTQTYPQLHQVQQHFLE